VRSLDLSEFPPDLADEIRERSEAGHVSPGEVVADLVRIGLKHTPTDSPGSRHAPDITPDIVELDTPVNIPREPGIRCTNVRIVARRPISPLLLGIDYETPE
jgi:hypothetical protein